jgi:hypothetical protein
MNKNTPKGDQPFFAKISLLHLAHIGASTTSCGSAPEVSCSTSSTSATRWRCRWRAMFRQLLNRLLHLQELDEKPGDKAEKMQYSFDLNQIFSKNTTTKYQRF